MKHERILSALVDNWINGNRTEAKKQAARFSALTLAEYLTQYRDWPTREAWTVAEYLKGADNYQAACDATTEATAHFNP